MRPTPQRVGRVLVEVASGTVIPGRRPRVGVTSCVVHIPEARSSIQRQGNERVPEVVGVPGTLSKPFAPLRALLSECKQRLTRLLRTGGSSPLPLLSSEECRLSNLRVKISGSSTHSRGGNRGAMYRHPSDGFDGPLAAGC
jgi:hypothetical protein